MFCEWPNGTAFCFSSKFQMFDQGLSCFNFHSLHWTLEKILRYKTPCISNINTEFSYYVTEARSWLIKMFYKFIIMANLPPKLWKIFMNFLLISASWIISCMLKETKRFCCKVIRFSVFLERWSKKQSFGEKSMSWFSEFEFYFLNFWPKFFTRSKYPLVSKISLTVTF